MCKDYLLSSESYVYRFAQYHFEKGRHLQRAIDQLLSTFIIVYWYNAITSYLLTVNKFETNRDDGQCAFPLFVRLCSRS